MSNFLSWVNKQTFGTKELVSNDTEMKGSNSVKVNGPATTNSIGKNVVETKENDAIVQVI